MQKTTNSHITATTALVVVILYLSVDRDRYNSMMSQWVDIPVVYQQQHTHIKHTWHILFFKNRSSIPVDNQSSFKILIVKHSITSQSASLMHLLWWLKICLPAPYNLRILSKWQTCTKIFPPYKPDRMLRSSAFPSTTWQDFLQPNFSSLLRVLTGIEFHILVPYPREKGHWTWILAL